MDIGIGKYFPGRFYEFVDEPVILFSSNPGVTET